MKIILHTSLKKVSNVGQSQFGWNIFINSNRQGIICIFAPSLFAPISGKNWMSNQI